MSADADYGCPSHPLYRPVVSNGAPWHDPHCPACVELWLRDGSKLKTTGETPQQALTRLRKTLASAPQNKETPWWLRRRPPN